MSKLSKRQQSRLGGLLTLEQGRIPHGPIADDLQLRGLACMDGDMMRLTKEGENERDRLQILAGLMVTDEYVQSRREQFASRMPHTSNQDHFDQQNMTQSQPSDHTKNISLYSKK